MKTVFKYLFVLVSLIVTYLFFGAGAYLMPDKAVHHHVKQTLEHGDLCSDQPRAVLPSLLQTRMDNYTDAIILNQADVMRVEGFSAGVLSVPRWWAPLLPFEVLRAGVDGQQMEIRHYARYWHGNTFLTRYLLAFCDYVNIRFLLYIVSSMLLVWCGTLLCRKSGWQTVAAVMFGLFVCYAFVMQFSMQFAMVLILTLAGMIAIANARKSLMPFFVIGSLVCFFDLLTAPMLTLGMMLVVHIALMSDREMWQGWKQGIYGVLLWTIGYAGTWVAKWIIATLFTSENVIHEGIENIINRSGVDDFSRWDAVMVNIDLLPWKYIVVAVLAVAFLAIIWFNVKGWRRAVQLLPIAVLPWVWYFLAANHSYWHSWFTFRAQAVSVAAIILALMQMVDWKRIKIVQRTN